jgi:hypothetical protein
MGTFLRTPTGPVEPIMEIYELDVRESVASIDSLGKLFLHGSFYREQFHIDKISDRIISTEEAREVFPKILFADVPVLIHTIYGFSLSPMSNASSKTGPNESNA